MTPPENSPVTSDGVKPFLEAPKWDKTFLAFGDRLDFLSPEQQHLQTGKLRILPARGERKRYNTEE